MDYFTAILNTKLSLSEFVFSDLTEQIQKDLMMTGHNNLTKVKFKKYLLRKFFYEQMGPKLVQSDITKLALD